MIIHKKIRIQENSIRVSKYSSIKSMVYRFKIREKKMKRQSEEKLADKFMAAQSERSNVWNLINKSPFYFIFRISETGQK